MSIELLAPAGSLDCGLAAFKYGADAVYLGLKQFSARADAANFDLEELQVLTGIAHNDAEHPRKIYVAVNTLVYDNELDSLAESLSEICDLGIDAVIVQDWGTYQILRRYFPQQVIHASTQMVIHNVQGMIEARRLGFKRVIASRELTLPEITEMAAVPGIELEVFGHGALCYAYSGLCLLSSVLRGASGNRGECTYVCRSNCRLEANGKTICQSCNLMSMKDLAAGDLIPKLQAAGVCSLKIEGRKKTPLYVSAVTDYYRRLIDGRLSEAEKTQAEDRVKTIFSRPWTKFHLANPRAAGVTDTKTVGHRGIPVGNILAVVRGQEGQVDRLRFTLENQVLEKHDGLQIEIPGRDKPFGFSVEAIRTFQQGNFEEGNLVFEAKPDTTIEVPLPEIHPELTAGLPVFLASSQRLKRLFTWPSARPALDRQRRPASFRLQVKAGSLAVTTLAGGQSFCYEQALETTLTPARNPQTAVDMAFTAFQKLGDSQFSFAGLEVINPDGLFAPLSLLNDVRRQAVQRAEDGLLAARRLLTSELRPVLDRRFPKAAGEVNPLRLQVKIDRPYYLNVMSASERSCISEVIFDIGRTEASELEESLTLLSNQFGQDRLRLALPAIIRPGQWQNWQKVAERLCRQGWKRWQVSNPGTLEMLRGADLTADWQFYACNQAAALTLLDDCGLRQVTLMPDDDWENTLFLLGKLGSQAAVLLYQDTPLALSAICANASQKGFCPGPRECDFREFTVTTNKAGEKLLAINNHCQSVYISAEPLDRRREFETLRQAGACTFRADFIWREYTPVRVHEILADILGKL